MRLSNRNRGSGSRYIYRMMFVALQRPSVMLGALFFPDPRPRLFALGIAQVLLVELIRPHALHRVSSAPYSHSGGGGACLRLLLRDPALVLVRVRAHVLGDLALLGIVRVAYAMTLANAPSSVNPHRDVPSFVAVAGVELGVPPPAV